METTVYKALNNLKLNFQKVHNHPHQIVYRIGMGLDNGRVDCFVDMRPEDKQVILVAVCGTLIPDNRRKQIAEFITRANFGLLLGNFELNFDNGELRYKCCFVYDGPGQDSVEVFIRNFFASFKMMDRYLPGIMAVTYANTDPKSAISQIEDSINPALN